MVCVHTECRIPEVSFMKRLLALFLCLLFLLSLFPACVLAEGDAADLTKN